jgi:hypothetical protein
MKQAKAIARRIGLALFTLCCGVGKSTCTAAPLVLHGTATIATAAHGLSDDLISINPLPLAVLIGDTFQFRISIDQTTSASEPPSYPATFSAEIGGVEVVDAKIAAYVFDDSLIEPRYIAEQIFVDAIPAFGDQFAFSDVNFASAGHLLSEQAVTFKTSFLFTSPLSFQPHDSSLLTSTQIPKDTTTWQAFFQKELSLEFDNRSYLGAYIDTIAVAPEPSAFALVAVAIIALSIRCLFSRHDVQCRRST